MWSFIHSHKFDVLPPCQSTVHSLDSCLSLLIASLTNVDLQDSYCELVFSVVSRHQGLFEERELAVDPVQFPPAGQRGHHGRPNRAVLTPPTAVPASGWPH